MLGPSDLHSYQQDAVTRLYESDAVVLIAPMGGGKTVSSLTAIRELMDAGEVRKAIVLAPKLVAQSVWPAEAGRWSHLKDLSVVYVAGPPAKRAALLSGPGDVFVVGIDVTQWLMDQIEDWAEDDPRLDLLVIDELSRFKQHNGKRTRSLMLAAPRFKMRWGLTGTPRPNGEIDLYGPARIIARGAIWQEPFEQWRMRYFMPEDLFTQNRWIIRDEWKQKIWDDFAPYSHVVEPDDLPPQPELVTMPPVWLQPPAGVVREYNHMMRRLFMNTSQNDIVLALNAAVASGKLDQIAQGFIYRDGETLERLHDLKARYLSELLLGVEGDQVMICYWYREDMEVLSEIVPGIRFLGSGTKRSEVEGIVDDWNAGRITHLGVHPASAGHGLNLQRGHAGHIIHYCQTWSAELFAQVNARIARQGNDRDRVMNHLIMLDLPTERLKYARVQGKIDAEKSFIEYLKTL